MSKKGKKMLAVSVSMIFVLGSAVQGFCQPRVPGHAPTTARPMSPAPKAANFSAPVKPTAKSSGFRISTADTGMQPGLVLSKPSSDGNKVTMASFDKMRETARQRSKNIERPGYHWDSVEQMYVRDSSNSSRPAPGPRSRPSPSSSGSQILDPDTRQMPPSQGGSTTATASSGWTLVPPATTTPQTPRDSSPPVKPTPGTRPDAGRPFPGPSGLINGPKTLPPVQVQDPFRLPPSLERAVGEDGWNYGPGNVNDPTPIVVEPVVVEISSRAAEKDSFFDGARDAKDFERFRELVLVFGGAPIGEKADGTYVYEPFDGVNGTDEDMEWWWVKFQLMDDESSDDDSDDGEEESASEDADYQEQEDEEGGSEPEGGDDSRGDPDGGGGDPERPPDFRDPRAWGGSDTGTPTPSKKPGWLHLPGDIWGGEDGTGFIHWTSSGSNNAPDPGPVAAAPTAGRTGGGSPFPSVGPDDYKPAPDDPHGPSGPGAKGLKAGAVFQQVSVEAVVRAMMR